MFCRCVALSVAVALLFGANAKADPFVFDPDGNAATLNSISNAAGFDPSPGNILSVGGNTAVANFVSSGGAVQTPFVTYFQATIPTVLVGGGGPSVGVNTNLTVVAGLTERVIAATALGPNGVASFALIPGAAVNYLEIYQGGAVANNLAGTGFNDGNLVLRAQLTALQTAQAFTVGPATSQQDLDQFLGDNYATHDTLTGSGGFTILGTVTFVNPNYITGVAAGNIINFNLSTSTVSPFVQVDPSAAFLIGTTGTAVGAAPVTAGAGIAGAPGVGIGAVNLSTPTGPGGPDIQVQADAAISFAEVPGTGVPEPATMAVFGLMAVSSGMYGAIRRRAKAVATVA